MSLGRAFNDNDRRSSNNFPFVKPFETSNLYFPFSEDASIPGIGSPFGFYVRPFITQENNNDDFDNAVSGIGVKLARCKHCSAYINSYCDITHLRWFCSLCGTKNMLASSNRHLNVDLKEFIHKHDHVQDVEVPFKSNDGISSEFVGRRRIEAERRPFVNVFCIQEDIEFDSMQSVVNSIISSIAHVHPSIEVVLLTISQHRVGLYRLFCESPTVQYINIVKSLGNSIEELMLPISSLNDFLGLSTPLGQCRNSLETALNAILDASVNVDTSERISFTVLHTIFHSLKLWILRHQDLNRKHEEKMYTSENYDDIHDFVRPIVPQSLHQTSSVSIPFFQELLNSFGTMILGPGEDEQANLSDIAKTKAKTDPIDLCSGVAIHVFLAPSKQSQSNIDMTQEEVKNCDWAKDIAIELSSRGVCVNIYSISNFNTANQTANLNCLLNLPKITGGKMHRFTLGTDISQERLRLSETLKRELCHPRATKCMMKVRVSPGAKIVANSMSGGFCDDSELEGVVRMGSMVSDSTFGLQIIKDDSVQVFNIEAIVIQVAMAYETLLTGDESLAELKEYEDGYSLSCIRNLFTDESNALSSLQPRIEYRIDNTKKLYSARRLRIITVAIEITKKPSQILYGINSRAIMASIIREGASIELDKAKDLVIDWATTITAGCCILSKKSSTAKIAMTKDEIAHLMRDSRVYDLLRHLYGAFNFFVFSQEINKASGNSSTICDEVAERLLRVVQMEPFFLKKALYPDLIGLTRYNSSKSQHDEGLSHSVVRDILPLRRESVVMSASSDFLIDSGAELVIYRSNPPRSVTSSNNLIVDLDQDLINSPIWIVNYLRNRLDISSVPPRVVMSSAGTDTADAFNFYLIEDFGQALSSNGGFDDFFSSISENVYTKYFKE